MNVDEAFRKAHDAWLLLDQNKKELTDRSSWTRGYAQALLDQPMPLLNQLAEALHNVDKHSHRHEWVVCHPGGKAAYLEKAEAVLKELNVASR